MFLKRRLTLGDDLLARPTFTGAAFHAWPWSGGMWSMRVVSERRALQFKMFVSVCEFEC